MLGNARHEAFAQGVAEGKSSRAAYMAAFPKCKKDVAADASATKLLSRPEVRARVDELIAMAAEKAGVTIERVVAELAPHRFLRRAPGRVMGTGQDDGQG